ncbi:outer membrane beta-barrel protein, partial [Flavobacteriaceae bacterium]|nr:outer membrane beta-barrel protein [Flavobacteriaceae bacterium]
MKYLYTLFFFLFITKMVAQESIPSKKNSYREDQWYTTLSFLLANESIDGFRSNGLSQAFSIGFIRDYPINIESNKAVGVGLGYGINNFGSNLTVVQGSNSSYQFNLIQNTLLASKNRLITHFIEVPLEYRWRTSTVNDYTFWRIYAGYLFRYNFFSKSKPFTGASTVLDEVNRVNILKFYTAKLINCFAPQNKRMKKTIEKENYLKAFYKLEEKDQEISVTALSQYFRVSKSTVSNMIKKLVKMGFVNTEPYKPIILTESGKTKAIEIISKHRLIELYLVNVMNFDLNEVHEIAEEIEHIENSKFFNRMREILGDATLDP